MMPRRLQAELMDDPALALDEHRHALDGLARLNRLSGAARALWPHVRSVPIDEPGRTISVLDIATGSADVPIGLAQRAGPSMTLDLAACDTSAAALRIAADRARAAGVPLMLEQRDVIARGLDRPDSSVDIVMCSLFLHHLPEDAVVALLAEMRRVARRRVLISDLRRCAGGLAAAYIASRLTTRSRVVHVDAVRSVQGSFTINELRTLADRAGMRGAVLRRCWPFRMLLRWDKTGTPRSRSARSGPSAPTALMCW